MCLQWSSRVAINLHCQVCRSFEMKNCLVLQATEVRLMVQTTILNEELNGFVDRNGFTDWF